MYREQYDRMMRWYRRFEAVDRGRPHDVPSDHYLDEIHAFFQNCYHLKDWLKNDAGIDPAVRQRVEQHINNSPELRVCADICNLLKHLRLRPERIRSGETPTFGRKQFALELGGAEAKISLTYWIETDSGPINAF